MRQKEGVTSPTNADSRLDKNKMSVSVSQGEGVVKESPTPPCMIIQMFQPPSAVRLAKEVARIDELVTQFPLQQM
jgi:hypothetical protein